MTGDHIVGEYDLYKCESENDCDHWWSTNNPECSIGGNNLFISYAEPTFPFYVTIHIVKPTGTENYTETISSYSIIDCAPTAGLVAYYPFNGDTNDASGNGNNGTIVGGVTYTTSPAGQAISLDGIDDWVNVGDVDALDGQQQITISAIVNPSETQWGGWNIVTKHDTWGEQYYYFSFSARTDGTLFFGISEDPSYGTELHAQTTSPVFSINEWQHVAVVFDGSQPALEDRIKFFYNGVAQNSTLTSIYDVDQTPVNDKPLRIGATRSSAGGYYPFAGMIDEVYLYNRALSETEIQQLYNLNN